jgi:hypothetical protein
LTGHFSFWRDRLANDFNWAEQYPFYIETGEIGAEETTDFHRFGGSSRIIRVDLSHL